MGSWTRASAGCLRAVPEGRRQTDPASPAPSVPGYLGCFVDSGAPPALSGPSGTSTKLTVQVCLRFCRMKGYQVLSTGPGQWPLTLTEIRAHNNSQR